MTSPARPDDCQPTVVHEPLLGSYRLLGQLGSGGMGTVHRAIHVHLDKVVAVKLLPPDRLIDAEGQARFQREMRAVGRVEHTNVIRASDAGVVDGQPFLVMEYAEGLDLSRVISALGRL